MHPAESILSSRRLGLEPKQAIGIIGAGALLATLGYVLYQKELSPEQKEMSFVPYTEDIANTIHEQEYEVINLAGIVIDALNDPLSRINVSEETITTSPKFQARLIRDNGKVRDSDVLGYHETESGFEQITKTEVKSFKANAQKRVSARATVLKQPAPVVSICSFDSHKSLFHSATIIGDNGLLNLRQGYVEQPLPESSFQKWKLLLPKGVELDILNPWEQYWRSIIRYSSGAKPKDKVKLEKMLTVMRATPGLAEQEDSELCRAYAQFNSDMLAGNSWDALRSEIASDERNLRRIGYVGLLALARSVMHHGQRSKTIERIVQGSPKLFDPFMGM